MTGQQGEAAKLWATVKAVKDFMQIDDITVMGFFSNLKDPRLEVFKETGWELSSISVNLVV